MPKRSKEPGTRKSKQKPSQRRWWLVGIIGAVLVSSAVWAWQENTKRRETLRRETVSALDKALLGAWPDCAGASNILRNVSEHLSSHLVGRSYHHAVLGAMAHGVCKPRESRQLLVALADAGADASVEMKDSPSSYFKAVVMHQMYAASTMVRQLQETASDLGAGIVTRVFRDLRSLSGLEQPRIHNEIYAPEWVNDAMLARMIFDVPCKAVVDTSRLLLRVDSLLRQGKSLEEALRVVAQQVDAEVGQKGPSGWSTIVPPEDVARATRFAQVVAPLLNASPLEGVFLRDVFAVLHELVLAVAGGPATIGTEATARALSESSHEQHWGAGRSVIHTLAASGADEVLQALLVGVQTDTLGVARDKVKQALARADERGLTPSHWAALRWGDKSSTLNLTLALEYAVTGSATSIGELGRWDKRTESHFVTAETSHHDGNWSAVRLKDPELYHADETRCDVDEVSVGPGHHVEELNVTTMLRYVHQGRPVIFRGVHTADSSLRAALARNRFLRRFGKERALTGVIPYAGNFGAPGGQTQLHDVARVDSRETPTKAPTYAFSTAAPEWAERLAQEVPAPAFVSGLEVPSQQQLYLGPAGSGAPLHFHGHAFNALAWGTKQWYLLPPTDAVFSKQPALDWARNLALSSAAGSHVGHAPPLRCAQRAGDVLYVPALWSHATLNLQQAIGMAWEVSLEGFCME